MDFDKLSKVTDSGPSKSHVTVSIPNNNTKNHFKVEKHRITDSVILPNMAASRKAFIEKEVRAVLASTNLEEAECKYIIDSFLMLSGGFEKRINRISDSLQSTKAGEQTIQTTLTKLKEELDSYKAVATIEEYKRVVDDSNVIIQTQEEVKQDLEAKKLEQQEMEAALELQRKEIEEREKQANNPQTIKDAYDPTLLAKFATAMEDWITTGSNMLAQKIKLYAEAIGSEKLITLVNKATDYDLDLETYESTVDELKEELNANNLSIPSLALITDSTVVELLKEKAYPVEQAMLQSIILTVQNFVMDPNSEQAEKLQTYIDKVAEDSEIKKYLTELMDTRTWMGIGKDSSFLAEIAKYLKSISKGDQEVELTLSPMNAIESPVSTVDEIYEPISSTLNKIQFAKVSDSAKRFQIAKKLARKVIDCNCMVKEEYVRVPYIGSVAPIEGTEALSVCIDGVAHIYMLNEGVSSAEALVTLQNMGGDYNSFLKYAEANMVPLRNVLEVAEDMESLDLVTDSILYKRHITDSYWVTEVMDSASFRKLLPKFKNLLGNAITDSMIPDGKVRMVVSKVAITDSVVRDFLSISTKQIADIAGADYFIKICLG